MPSPWDIDIVFVPAKIGGKKHSNTHALANNVALWYRYSKTKIKNDFKARMKEWSLPIYESEPHDEAEVHFQIFRDSNRKIDSDSMSISTFKWALDLLVEQGYLSDDDRVKIVLHPTKLDKDSKVKYIETMVHMQVKLI
jgi:hypothetical protein